MVEEWGILESWTTIICLLLQLRIAQGQCAKLYPLQFSFMAGRALANAQALKVSFYNIWIKAWLLQENTFESQKYEKFQKNMQNWPILHK